MERLHTDVQAGSQKTRKGQLRHCEGGHRGKPAPAVGLGVEGREGPRTQRPSRGSAVGPGDSAEKLIHPQQPSVAEPSDEPPDFTLLPNAASCPE